MSGVFRTIDPPPPLHPASVASPAQKAGGGVHTRRAVRGRGTNISEDARHWIGLQYNPSTVQMHTAHSTLHVHSDSKLSNKRLFGGQSLNCIHHAVLNYGHPYINCILYVFCKMCSC